MLPQNGHVALPAPAREWFRQSFEGEELSAALDTRTGKLTREKDYVTGVGVETFEMALQKDLPENVEISLEIKLLAANRGGPTHAVLGFSDDAFTTYWHAVVVGTDDLRTAYLSKLGNKHRIRTNVPLIPDHWHTLRLQMIDERLSVGLDHENLFAYQNDFPPLYKQRCRFTIGAYRSSLCFRNLIIRDMGIPQMTRSIRQGDALYNAKAYDAAREFYCRLFEMQSNSADAQELHYKIGMCHFSLKALSLARSWLERTVAMQGKGFWADQASLMLMHIDLLEEKPAGLDNARRFFADPRMRDDARIVLESTCRSEWERGNFDKFILLKKLVLEMYGPGGPLYGILLREIAEAQEWLMKMGDCEAGLIALLRSDSSPGESRIMAIRELGYIYLMQGKMNESEDCQNRIVQATKNADALADVDIQRSFRLRGSGQADESLALLDSVSARRGIPDRAALAKLEASLILCGLGRVEEARAAIHAAQEINPSILEAYSGSASRYLYVPEFVSGNFEKAAELLLVDSRFADSAIFTHGQQAMAAALVTEISGDVKKARRIWAEMLRRFPLQRCAHLSPAVEEWLKGNSMAFAQLPLGNQRLSEMLYLAARACEKKGDTAHGKALLERCAQLDFSLRWPAYCAKQKLNSLPT